MLGTGFVGLLFIYSMLADLIPRDSKRCGRNRSAFLFALLNLMAKFGVAASIAVSYAALDVVGFDPQNGRAAARELHLIFALQPTAAWMVMIGLLIWMHRELAHLHAHAPTLAIASRPTSRPVSSGQIPRFSSAFLPHLRGGWAELCPQGARSGGGGHPAE